MIEWQESEIFHFPDFWTIRLSPIATIFISNRPILLLLLLLLFYLSVYVINDWQLYRQRFLLSGNQTTTILIVMTTSPKIKFKRAKKKEKTKINLTSKSNWVNGKRATKTKTKTECNFVESHNNNENNKQNKKKYLIKFINKLTIKKIIVAVLC